MLALLGIAALAAPTPSRAGEISIGISVRIGPPPLPVYEQPLCPGPGYMWTPGYWAYDPANGYFWVPGTWVMAPAPGYLWTPGYWGWGGAAFVWHAGYWGPHVGFYGGINYGFGYTGVGFVGGEWRGGTFFYNRSVTRINVTNITNVYSRTVVNNFAVSRVSYNGGQGGLMARATPGELAAERDRHIAATAMQQQHEVAARSDRSQFASMNHGVPGVAATGRPGEFRGAGVVRSTRAGGPVSPEVYHAGTAGHSNPQARTFNPSGGSRNEPMATHSNPPAPHSYNPRPEERTATGGSRNNPPAHTPASQGSEPSHQAGSHSSQPQEHGAKPSGGGKGGGEKHDSEPHH